MECLLYRGEPVTTHTVGGALGGEGADGPQGLPATGLVLLKRLETIPYLGKVLGSVAVGLALLGLGLAVRAVSGEGAHDGVLPHARPGPGLTHRLKLHSS